MELWLRRAVTREECNWLERDLAVGERVFAYRGATYGCISHKGMAVTLQKDKTPFFELPLDALTSSIRVAMAPVWSASLRGANATGK